MVNTTNFLKVTFFICILLASQYAKAADHPINLQQASAYFEEIRHICDTDNGAVWGENLWGPILLIDPQTRFVVANQPDNEGLLEKAGDVHIGYFPPDKSIANSTIRFDNIPQFWIKYRLIALLLF